MRRATIKDIAERAGVSTAAVSKALNGKPDVSETTRARVWEAARALDYQPNSLARGLVSRRTGTVGLFFLDRDTRGFSHPFAAQVISGLLDTLTTRGYHCVLFSTPGNPHATGEPASYLSLCRQWQVEGAAFMGLRLNDPALRELARSELPVITIDVPLEGPRSTMVGVDNRRAQREAVAYVASLGHRRIAFVNGHLQAAVSLERLAGFREGLADAGLTGPDEWTVASDFTEGGGYAATRALLRRADRPTAILYASDLMALGGYRAAREAGLAIPRDLSIVGFDDIDQASRMDPPLTTVHQERYELGRSAARALLEALDHGRSRAWVPVPWWLERRASCGPPAA
ncbi:LacI family DNA-binding transcriptional regulator [Limnochorda pilosa]|uniref:LacI family transcriptional regulator n=1 Tax=Limnochorda pilosa TaxID=1555112 RepID=A0A0K2SFX4_LIMPI|nr:LacI family DNA-binding transcriptional regulator [Limnochorda pilosa]BAS25937.1 LacI family transcriptional regulator [Limnochorda pilosa]